LNFTAFLLNYLQRDSAIAYICKLFTRGCLGIDSKQKRVGSMPSVALFARKYQCANFYTAKIITLSLPNHS